MKTSRLIEVRKRSEERAELARRLAALPARDVTVAWADLGTAAYLIARYRPGTAA